MENKGNFRKALFGFNTKDVMEYIAMLHNEFYAFRQESEKQIYDLMRKIDELQEAVDEDKKVVSVFGGEENEFLSELGEKDETDKINGAAQRLENILGEIEALINKTQ